MGEFLYRNGIDFTAPGFLRIATAPGLPAGEPTAPGGQVSAGRPLAMFSGGKDSLALTHALKDGPVDFFLYNPTQSQRALARSLADGGRITEVHQSVLPELLAMNDSGEFLNGHTPYSAYLALAATLTGYLRGNDMIVAGNSRSDDEPNVSQYLGRPEAGHYLLPPHQAAWIPTALRHKTTLNAGAQTLAVLFEPGLVPMGKDRVRIIAVSALLREMMLYSARWPISRTESGAEADSFFQALGYVVADALDDEMPLNLPVPADPVVAAATDYTRAHLDRVTVSDVTRAVGVSERTLRRIFHAHLGMSWRSYLLRARVLRSMAMLVQPDRTVLEVSIAVGFDDAGAFARSFARHCGETPSAYKRRVGC
jgi:AraC-like DNA-binding protein